MQTRHHYLPQFLIKKFADARGDLHRYPLLVPSPRRKLWLTAKAGQVGKLNHLHTFIGYDGHPSDSFEVFLASRYEDPAAKALHQFESMGRFEAGDLDAIFRFTLLQSLRTVARYNSRQRDWTANREAYERSESERVRELLNSESQRCKVVCLQAPSLRIPYPMNVYYSPEPDGAPAIRTEIAAGRQLFLSEIERALAAFTTLPAYDMTLMQAPCGFQFVLSDDPVLHLLRHGRRLLEGNGNWHLPGSVFMMALNTRQLIAIEIKPFDPHRRAVVPGVLRLRREIASDYKRRLIIQSCRFVLAADEDPLVPLLRPCEINLGAWRVEEDRIRDWNRIHSEAVMPKCLPGERLLFERGLRVS